VQEHKPAGFAPRFAFPGLLPSFLVLHLEFQ
jgi:hypothetical protein